MGGSVSSHVISGTTGPHRQTINSGPLRQSLGAVSLGPG